MTNWRKILSWQFNEYTELKRILDEKGYDYQDLGNELIINHKGYVDLPSLTSLPDNIQFNNGENVHLDSLTSLPNNIQFNNRGNVWLSKLRSLPNNKYEIFHNEGIVYYDWDGDKYTKFNPNQRNASLKFSWKLPNIKIGDRVRVTNDSNLLSTINLGKLNIPSRNVEGQEGVVINIFKVSAPWSIPRYSGKIIIDFSSPLSFWDFPYSHWQDFLEIIG